ncbi:hypothetical protein M011DRAFT_490306 [Sporormia fimetaria CBS 119925]|uniref:DUF1772-domain-containing protein n=1 Tax=Sporormia fimetaria CBS 119925 TaxID=1340428 RepID=A0A6A6UZC0_9PLEO|nr:hypothetical protein M011DRAFT_490306 [Sporormia fimetaria CBS 119925]
MPSSPFHLLPPIIHLSITTIYTLTLSYTNITRLLDYESQAKTAAEWSDTAAERLRKTRTTQASGVVALAASLVSAFALQYLPKHQLAPTAALNAGLTGAAAWYMGRFWNEQTQVKVPFMQNFNAAVSGSEAEVMMLRRLCVSWGIAAGVWWMDANFLYLGVTALAWVGGKGRGWF